MRWRVFVASAIAGLLFASLLPSAPVAAEVWRIACDDNFPPYNFVDNDRVVGLDAEIVAAMVKQAGAEVDAAFQFVGRPDRFEKYFMIGPHRMGHTVFAARSGRDIPVQDVNALRGYRIGAIRGYTYGPAFDNAAGLTKDTTAGDNLQLVRMLAAGRVDLIIGDREALSHFARQAGLHAQMQVLQPVLSEVPRYIAVPRSKPAIAARLDTALAELRRNGGLAAILRRWE